MARIVGIFQPTTDVAAVMDQLHLNNITQITLLTADEIANGLSAPEAQSAEYQRRLTQGQQLLFVQVSATELPTVQRAFRTFEAADIDLLPE